MYNNFRQEESWYDTAQICLNGHVINSTFKAHPNFNKDYCDRCGESTITECKTCNAPIQGYYHVPRIISSSSISTPAYCHKCGKPYPWTQIKLQAAKDLTNEQDKLTQDDKKQLEQSLDNLVKDSPQTPVAATRFKKLMEKVGTNTADAFKQIIIDIVSESARKMIWGK